MHLPPRLADMKKNIIYFLFILRIHNNTGDQLKFVNVIYRHGDRAPLKPYPKDPYPVSLWKEGIGQLTDLGKTQMYDLGKYIWYRYNYTVNKKQIYVESSERNRTITSANLVMAGLYSTSGDNISLALAKVDPMQIRTIPKTEDNKILYGAPCRKFFRLQESVMKNNISLEVQRKYDGVLKNLSGFTGLDMNYSLTGLSRALTVFDTLSIEDLKGLKLPDWTRDFYPEPLRELFNFFAYTINYYTQELKRLRCGPLLKDIIKHFDDAVNEKSKLKMWQYSGHDTTIGGLLNCLNVFDGKNPSLASSVFIELHKSKRKEYKISITYRRDELEMLKIPGCSEYCPFDKFKELVNDVIPSDWKAECDT